MTHARERRINRFYGPSIDEFLSDDSLVAQTNQPYVFSNDDPLNAEDPLGDGSFLNVAAGCMLTLNCHGQVVSDAGQFASRANQENVQQLSGQVEDMEKIVESAADMTARRRAEAGIIADATIAKAKKIYDQRNEQTSEDKQFDKDFEKIEKEISGKGNEGRDGGSANPSGPPIDDLGEG